jgi:type II secretory ATPase GspE/PulE/Tfp pilus assembly ATPase PilB-like protein
MVQFNEEKQNARIEELKRREAESLTQTLSKKYGIPYLDLSTVPINIDALRVIKEIDAIDAQVAVFNIVDKKIHIGLLSPSTEKTKNILDSLQKRGYSAIPYLVSPESLKKVWNMYKDLSMSMETRGGALDISNEGILELLEKVTDLESLKKILEEGLNAKKVYRISRLLETMLAGALSNKASDIHIEPEEGYVRLRYRLDGVLTDIIRFDSETYNLMLSRIKLLSNLKLNIKGKAQDGRFSIKVMDDEIEIRTSLLPGAYNDSVVLRVLNPKSISVPLEDLGIHPRLLSVLQNSISKPNGMILNTGPTGSGKTTTLYAFLKKIHSPDIKIITIENPIEYHLPGIVQTQTNEDGYTFLEGLRSALRQDPDVIMVGEIRDNETAEIAINAALTGHLVFSTLHTNNAAGAFPRLIDLGVNPKVITSALSVCMAQRLVRKLCSDCKEQKEMNPSEKNTVGRIINSIVDKTYLENLSSEKIWNAKGCIKCNFTGYKGRVSIYEAILTDKNIEKIVQENPSEREIKKAAEPQNILNLQQDGIIKILQGMTSIEELQRVIDLEEER